MSPLAAVAEQRHELYDVFFNADSYYGNRDQPPAYDAYTGPTPGFFNADGGDAMMPEGMARAVVAPGYDEPDNASWLLYLNNPSNQKQLLSKMYKIFLLHLYIFVIIQGSSTNWRLGMERTGRRHLSATRPKGLH